MVTLTNEQFQQLISMCVSNVYMKPRSFAHCPASFDGTRNITNIEAFLTIIKAFKTVQKISDETALAEVSQLLFGEAEVWWQRIRQEVNTWDEFEKCLRLTFKPPPYLIYQDIILTTQAPLETTDVFLAKKRLLLSYLPAPAHSEEQQIDMVFGQLREDIRQAIPRTSVTTFIELLEAARNIEKVFVFFSACPVKSPERYQSPPQKLHSSTLSEKTPPVPLPHSAPQPLKEKKKRIRCSFCRCLGHTMDVCLKKIKKMEDMKKKLAQTEGESTVSQSIPKFSCHGCGTLGITRSKCPNCRKNIPVIDHSSQKLAFCAVDVS